MDEVDSLNFSINSEVKGAKEVDGFVQTLEKLKGSLENIEPVFTKIDKSSSAVANSFSAIKIPNNLFNSDMITKFTDNLLSIKSVIDEVVPSFNNLDKALEGIANKFETVAKTSTNAIKKIAESKITKDTGGSDAGNVTKNIEEVKIDVTPKINTEEATTGISRIVNEMNKIPIVSKAVHVATSAFQTLGRIAKGAVSSLSAIWGTVGPAFKKIAISALSLGRVIAGKLLSPLTTIKNFIGKLGSVFGGLGGKVTKAFAGLFRVAKYRVARAILNGIATSLKEGVSYAYQWSKAMGGSFSQSMDKMKTSVEYFKASLGSALIPVLEKIAPIFERVTNIAVNFVNKINQVVSALMGATTWTQAIKQNKEYAESTDEATESQEKLKRSLMGFDEINKLESQSSGTSEDKQDNADAYTYKTSNIDGNLNNIANKFKALAKKIKDIFTNIWDVFKKAWNSKGAGVIESIKKAFENMKGLFSALGESLSKVFNNGTGQKFFENIISIVKNTIDLFGNLAKAIEKAWQKNDIGTKIIQNIANDINNVAKFFADIIGDTADWVAGVDFYPLLEGIEKVTSKFTALRETIFTSLRGVYNEVLLPIAEWTIEDAAPVALDTIAKALDAINTAWVALKPYVAEIYDKLLKPIGEEIGQDIINAFKGIGTAMDNMKKYFEDLKEPTEVATASITKFKDILLVVLNAIELLAKGFLKLIGIIADTVGLDVLGLSNIDFDKQFASLEKYGKEIKEISDFQNVEKNVSKDLENSKTARSFTKTAKAKIQWQDTKENGTDNKYIAKAVAAREKDRSQIAADNQKISVDNKLSLNVNLDGKQIYSTVVKENKKQKAILGKNPLS